MGIYTNSPFIRGSFKNVFHLTLPSLAFCPRVIFTAEPGLQA
jgi:hypothetical protein